MVVNWKELLKSNRSHKKVRVCLSDIVLTDASGLPKVVRIPKPKEDAAGLIWTIVTANPPIVGPKSENSQRRCLGNTQTVALLKALIPAQDQKDFPVDCIELSNLALTEKMAAAHGQVLNLMVKEQKSISGRTLLRFLRNDCKIGLRRPSRSSIREIVSKRVRGQ